MEIEPLSPKITSVDIGTPYISSSYLSIARWKTFWAFFQFIFVSFKMPSSSTFLSIGSSLSMPFIPSLWLHGEPFRSPGLYHVRFQPNGTNSMYSCNCRLLGFSICRNPFVIHILHRILPCATWWRSDHCWTGASTCCLENSRCHADKRNDQSQNGSKEKEWSSI